MASSSLRIALCQINTVPADLPGNLARILASAATARDMGADLAVFPELALEGYSPRDLLLRKAFTDAVVAARAELTRRVEDLPLLLGTVLEREGPGRPLVNGAVLLQEGEERARFAKSLLPQYDVFDETRYFEPGEPGGVFSFRDHLIGVTICEDMWAQASGPAAPRYCADPVKTLADKKVDILINLSASPFGPGRPAYRERLLGETARRARCPVVLCNLVGGNDEILFDGHSLAVSAEGNVIARAPGFEPAVTIADLGDQEAVVPQVFEPVQELHSALVMGVRDYARKCGFDRAHLGLSGGVDSAITAAIAVDALGPAQVSAVALPSPFSSPDSLEDASQLADLLGISLDVVAIEKPYEILLAGAREVVGEGPFGVMEENIQARIRGLLLMAVANRNGSLLLTTGNKSEMSVGYCTLYGDMSGGLAVISDVWKTDVYRLAALYESKGSMPERIISKEPSAELRPDQRDQDTLPPYDRLDRILQLHIEDNLDAREIHECQPDFDLEEIRRVLGMVARNEYKRNQAPPGLRVSKKAFGIGRRMPIVAADLDYLNLPGGGSASPE